MQIPTIHTSGNTYREKGRNATATVFGIPIAFADILEQELVYKPNLIVDSDYLVPLKSGAFRSSELIVMIDHDFVEKYYEIYYFGPMDILSLIGGLNASIAPALGMLTPLFIIGYLYQLAGVIIEKNKATYKSELITLHHRFCNLFKHNDIQNFNISENEKNKLHKFISLSDDMLQQTDAEVILEQLVETQNILKRIYAGEDGEDTKQIGSTSDRLLQVNSKMSFETVND